MSKNIRALLHTLLLIVLVAVGSLWRPAAVAPAGAADATLVFAALEVLKDKHVARPDPIRLLDESLNGVRQALVRAGVAQTITSLTSTNEENARAEFQARFDQAVALAEGKVSPVQLQYAAVKAMATSMDDSHTHFLTPEEAALERARERNQAVFAGVGIFFLQKEGRWYVWRLFADGPAARAGLRRFDHILSIDGRDTQAMAGSEVTERIRGASGTTVVIVVRRSAQSNPLTFSIPRAPITVPTVDARMLAGSVGYIWFSQFIRGSSRQFRQALEDLKGQGMRALVLDLRPNLGGLPTEGVELASMFLPAGLPFAVYEDRRGGKRTKTTAGRPLLDPSTGLVLVVDDSTHSMGELFSAAIQEYKRGKLVGAPTGGRGTSADTFPLPRGAAINVTTERVMTGKGAVVEKVGVRPDVPVDLTAGDLDGGVDTQLQRAIQIARQ